MSPRKRHPRNAHLPDNLRVRNGYYSYTHPGTGVERGLGRDKGEALGFARAANAEWHRLQGQHDAAAWIRGESVARTWGAWLDRYQAIYRARGLRRATLYNYEHYLRVCRERIEPARAFESVDVAAVAEAVKVYVDAGKTQAAKSFRVYLIDVFREAMAEGWCNHNPAEATRRIQHTARRARLTIDVVRRLLDLDLRPWLRNAILLGLVSGQRREDVMRAQRRDIRDGHWWCEQRKTGSRVAIPLALRMDAIGISLQDVLEQCQGNILSPWIIHQTRDNNTSKRGAKISPQSLTIAFQEAMQQLPIDWDGKTPPTFHELRSLAARLYEAQGGVDPQHLLGHKSASTTAIYTDARGEWIKVSVK